MSKKTMKQRIALVAVSALTAGVLSVASAPVANAALAVGDIDLQTSSAILNVGVCSNGMTNALNTSVATVRSGTDYQFVGTGLDAGDTLYMSLSGPAIFKSHTLTAGAAGGATLTATTLTDAVTAVEDKIVITVTGVGTISMAFAADAASSPVDTITITSVAACANAAWSATNSLVQMSTTAAGNASSNVDAATSTTAGTPMYIKLQPVDGYSAAITTGTLFASATNGALLSWGAAAAGFPAGTGSVATGTPTANHQLRVEPSQSATTSTTVVTITLNGGAIATKTITFHGEQASISVAATYAGRTSTGDSGVIVYQYKDSAGNVVPGSASAIVAASAGTRITTATNILSPNPGTKTTLVGTALADNMEYKLGGSSDNGVMAYTCGSSAGTADFTIATSSTVNANTITATVTGKCYGGLSTYTVATDKAKYNIGDIATLTISAKDSSGNPVSDNTQLQASSVSVGGGTATYTVLGTVAAGALETFTNGSVVIRAQMTTEGTFNTVVALTGAKDASAQASYIVVNPATVGAVSNAEVLKSIVALIASINKQIAALQKLILARR